MINILRYLVLANAALLIVQSVRVISVYSAVYSLTSGPKRQLPLHVWLIATSYLIYAAGTSFFLITGIGHELSRTLIYGAAGLLGQYALHQVLQYDRRKLTAATNFSEDEVDEPAH